MKDQKPNKSQLAKWIKIEMEHTKSKTKAEKVVMDHINEHGIKYYPSLQKMIKNLHKKAKNETSK